MDALFRSLLRRYAADPLDDGLAHQIAASALRSSGVSSQEKPGTLEYNLRELHDDLARMTCAWRPNPQGCDYECLFCGNTPRSNAPASLADFSDPNQHRDDCLGIALQKSLDAFFQEEIINYGAEYPPLVVKVSNE